MKNKKTLIFTSSLKFRDIELDLIQFIRNNDNYHTIFVVDTIEDKIFYNKNFPNCADEIKISSNEFDYLSQNYDKEKLIKKALKIEQKFECSIYRLFMIDRIIGRGLHASGGFYHPKTRLASDTSHFDILNIAVNRIEFWEDLFKGYNVKLVLNLPQIANRLAKLHNINAQSLYISKFNKRLYWSSDIFMEPNNIRNNYINYKKKIFKKISIESPHHNHMFLRNDIINNYGIINTLRKSCITFLRRIFGKIKGYRKGKNVYAISEFKYFWRRRNQFNLLKHLSTITINSSKNIKYIYFPLLTEPETSLHGVSQDFFFQLSAINMLSRDLPANYKIIVKEHLPAIGRRPKDFYLQILELKNVEMADPIDFGIEYIKNSSAVAVLTGTAGWEAAAMGIPVISFSKNNSYNFLDHVFYVDNPDDTHKILKIICSHKYPNSKSIEDGSRMHASYIKSSFNFSEKDPFKAWNLKNKKNNNKELIMLLYNNLKLNIKL